MAGSSVQFYGINSVVQAFENRNEEAWSIWQNKQFMFKGVGVDNLKTVLNGLFKSYSVATYTLKIYEDIDDEKKIKSTTPDDGSFNFKLFESENTQGFNINPMFQNQQSPNNELLEEMRKINERLNKIEDGDKEESRLGVIGEIMEHPTIGPIVTNLIDTISGAVIKGGINKALPMINQQQNFQRASINGIDDDKIINECIIKLKQHDDKLSLHLQKLVEIAETQPGIFKMFINQLDK